MSRARIPSVRSLSSSLLLGSLVFLLAACGSDAAPEYETTTSQAVSSRPAQHEGNYAVGDVYDDGEFRAEYLGLARLSLGRDSQWPDGNCFAFLAEVTRYKDFLDSGGTDTFNPSTRGILENNVETERDGTGVDCNTKPLQATQYVVTHKAKLHVGESAKVWTGAFWVSAADMDSLKGVQLHGGSGLFEPEVTLDASEGG